MKIGIKRERVNESRNTESGELERHSQLHVLGGSECKIE